MRKGSAGNIRWGGGHVADFLEDRPLRESYGEITRLGCFCSRDYTDCYLAVLGEGGLGEGMDGPRVISGLLMLAVEVLVNAEAHNEKKRGLFGLCSRRCDM